MSSCFRWQSGTLRFHPYRLETMPQAKPSLPSANPEALARNGWGFLDRLVLLGAFEPRSWLFVIVGLFVHAPVVVC
jgi:hypothetical protein